MSSGAKSGRTEGYELPVTSGVRSTNHAISFNATSVQTPAMQANTTYVELFATQDCFISVGCDTNEDPVAAAPDGTPFSSNGIMIPGGVKSWKAVEPGYKIAVIRISNNGVLYVTEGGV